MVGDSDLGGLTGIDVDGGCGSVAVGGGGDVFAVDLHLQTVIERVLGGEGEKELHGAGLGGVVVKFVVAGEVDGIGAVPEQAFLAVVEVEVDVDVRGVKGQGKGVNDGVVARDGVSVFLLGDGDNLGFCVGGGHRALLLRGAPG